jgi:hypothetical protein
LPAPGAERPTEIQPCDPGRPGERRGRRAVKDLGDVLERDGEEVMQDEREPLGRRELLEDDETSSRSGRSRV